MFCGGVVFLLYVVVVLRCDDASSTSWARMGTCPILAMADRSPTLTPTARIPLLPRGAPYVIQIKKTEGVQILLRC